MASNNQQNNLGATGAAESAVPTLRVMRLQSPDLYQPYAGSFEPRLSLGTAMCLPDSLGIVYVGETFTAYLGALNVSKDLSVRRLTVAAQLQTPSQRYRIPSRLDTGNSAGGVDVPPEQGIDAIVSYKLEEPGSHILRVEVGYVAAADGNVKTFRKFYRFQVSHPLTITERTVRADDESCIIAMSVGYNAASSSNATAPVAASGITICGVEFQPADGLTAERIGTTVSGGSSNKSNNTGDGQNAAGRERKSGVELLDSCGRLETGNCFQYLFKVKTESRNASIRGIAAGDELGMAVFTWSKTMGETGRVTSPTIHCPEAVDTNKLRLLAGGDNKPVDPNDTSNQVNQQNLMSDKNFVVQGSGLSVDVAAAAAKRAAANGVLPFQAPDQLLPVTVEPIRPPTRMKLAVPQEVQFLVMNHTTNPLALQLQFRFEKQQQEGLAICGHSFRSLGELAPQGGCTVVSMRITAVSSGLLRLHGCYVVDLTTDREIAQPPLFDVFVDNNAHPIESGTKEVPAGIVAAS